MLSGSRAMPRVYSPVSHLRVPVANGVLARERAAPRPVQQLAQGSVCERRVAVEATAVPRPAQVAAAAQEAAPLDPSPLAGSVWSVAVKA